MSPTIALQTLIKTEVVASLGVLDSHGFPWVALTPYVTLADPLRFYLLISDLSPQTGALRQDPRCSLLIHAPAQREDPKSNHALTRLSIQGSARFLSREAAATTQVESAYRQRFQIAEMLLGLADFHFCEITPTQGRFIQGFGQAFQVSGPNLEVIEHLTRT